ncbi:nuclear pore complex NUP96 [Olea europaea subsp. europaea]|uniref:Nuclear pore complex NUP96 n=1 Tax=Olea europaea subsp. europaea TaxID=158383 RepID=A0A8S0UWM8_OLEEU|nr:nuclear pore complex NUP96 [Olea europaea subsp. europaea]
MIHKTPLALIEYNPGSYNSSSPGSILMVQQNKGLHLKASKSEGFKLDLEHETPVSGSHSHNIVDAALFMSRLFRAGWGPNGVLVHCGMPVGSTGYQNVLSLMINLENVAIDKVTRDENNTVREELSDFCFDSPLNFHKELIHEAKEVEQVSFKLKLQKLVSNRMMLSEICRSNIGIVERQLELPVLSYASRVLLMHQVMSVKSDNEEDMMPDGMESAPEIELEALPLMRRVEFSCWLQESIYHRVQEEVSSSNEFSDLEHIFLLLTGRQMDGAVELAASRGDIRLLPPDTSLPDVLNTYQKLVNDGRVPNPVPVYIDEDPIEEDTHNWETVERFDLACCLMLLHARQENDFGALKTMFSALSSTNDPLDYHMIWHQRVVLEAIGTFSSNDLHVLDVGFVSQLLFWGNVIGRSMWCFVCPIVKIILIYKLLLLGKFSSNIVKCGVRMSYNKSSSKNWAFLQHDCMKLW